MVVAMPVIRRISLRRRRSIGGGVICLRGGVVVRRGAAISAVRTDRSRIVSCRHGLLMNIGHIGRLRPMKVGRRRKRLGVVRSVRGRRRRLLLLVLVSVTRHCSAAGRVGRRPAGRVVWLARYEEFVVANTGRRPMCMCHGAAVLILGMALVVSAIVAMVEARLAGHVGVLRGLLASDWILDGRDLSVPASFVVSKGHAWW